jgi:hypothetical protein
MMAAQATKCTATEYMGIRAVLLQAMYGLGNMRDERLTRMWKNNRVKFTTPPTTRTRTSAAGGNSDEEEEQEDSDSPKKEFFNLFVLHQNRVKRTAKVSQSVLCMYTTLVYMLYMLYLVCCVHSPV